MLYDTKENREGNVLVMGLQVDGGQVGCDMLDLEMPTQVIVCIHRQGKDVIRNKKTINSEQRLRCSERLSS